MKIHQKRLLDRGKIEKLVDALRSIESDNPELIENRGGPSQDENGQGQVTIKDYRRAKPRKKDLHDLSGLRIGLNDLAGEFEGIFCENDLYREHLEHPAEATTVYQQHWTRLQTIREKLGRLKLVMNSVDGNPDLSRPGQVDVLAIT